MALRLDEPLGIDPCVDVAFLWLFGGEAHERIRVDFLNAVLGPEARIARASVRSPVHPSAFDGQAEIRLDIQVEDEHGRTFQIEMQRRRHLGLDQRMLYDWARLYGEQLGKGTDYTELRPVVSVWICEQDAFPNAANAHLRFRLLEVDEQFSLNDDIRFEVVQLSRVQASGTGLPDAALGGWCRLLNEADQWREVPDVLHNPILEEAMSVLNEFRVDVRMNQIYRGREAYERVRAAELAELAELQEVKAERDAAVAASEADRAAKEAALAEVDRLAAENAALRARLGPTDR